jgi:pyruvate decarboxylase
VSGIASIQTFREAAAVNTGSFSYRMTADKQIELHSDHVIVQYARYEIGFHVLLPLLVEALKDIPHPDHFTPLKNGNLKAEASTGTLSQEKLWPHLAHFFKPEVSLEVFRRAR